jgi:hypothetical protein
MTAWPLRVVLQDPAAGTELAEPTRITAFLDAEAGEGDTRVGSARR